MTKEISAATRSRRPALVLLALLQKSPWQQLSVAPMVPAICKLGELKHISLEAQPFTVTFSPPISSEWMKVDVSGVFFNTSTRFTKHFSVQSKYLDHTVTWCCGPVTCCWHAVVLIPLAVQSCSARVSITAEALFTIDLGFAGVCETERIEDRDDDCNALIFFKAFSYRGLRDVLFFPYTTRRMIYAVY